MLNLFELEIEIIRINVDTLIDIGWRTGTDCNEFFDFIYLFPIKTLSKIHKYEFFCIDIQKMTDENKINSHSETPAVREIAEDKRKSSAPQVKIHNIV